MKQRVNKKGVSFFSPVLALIALGVIGFGLLKLASAPKITEQGVGDIQGRVVAAIADVQNIIAYHEQLAQYSSEEALLQLGNQAGISQSAARTCKRGTYYVYSQTCTPDPTKTYTELFSNIHNKKLEQKASLKKPEDEPFVKANAYTYTLTQDNEQYSLIAKADAAYSLPIKNKPEAEEQTTIGSMNVDLSYQIPIQQNFNDYTTIYDAVYSQHDCLLGNTYKHCLSNQRGYAWTVGDKDSGGFIPIKVVTNTVTKHTEKPIEITFFADPLWLKNTKP